MLRRQGIRAMMFGETHKTDFIIVPCVLFIVYVLLANTFNWPIWDVLVYRFWASDIPGWIGLVFGVAALIFFVYTLVSFGRSFRVGIDENKPADLVTSGAFAISRNPIYVCFLVFFTGLFLVHCNVVISVALVAFVFVIHRQIVREEKFLQSYYGEVFLDYCKRVRRYL
jgi:protein-S-isoprenylcysteine O-methyltransferase Ste14